MYGEVSIWKSVLSGVPQGSVLGPILFLVYIDDLEEGVTGNILTFAYDTNLFRKTKEIGDKQKLQDYIDKLVRLSEKWQMVFNFWKCKCLHTGPGNTGMNYEMGGTIYTIICLKYVCLSTFADCKSQFLLDRLGRCLKLIVSSGSASCHEFASQFGLAFFLYAKNIHKLSRMPSLAHMAVE